MIRKFLFFGLIAVIITILGPVAVARLAPVYSAFVPSMPNPLRTAKATPVAKQISVQTGWLVPTQSASLASSELSTSTNAPKISVTPTSGYLIDENGVDVSGRTWSTTNPSSIKIVATGVDQNLCQNKVTQALNFLKEQDQASYLTVTTYLGILECVQVGSQVFVEETPPRFALGITYLNGISSIGGIPYLAGIILHDATHSQLYHEYQSSHPGIMVPYTEYAGENGETIALKVNADFLARIGTDPRYVQTVRDMILSRWWEQPLTW